MNIIREVPLPALQAALYNKIKNSQNVTIYGGDAPEGATLPYITFGSTTAKPYLDKTIEMWTATINLDIWGNDRQRKAVNDIINDVVLITSYYGESLAMDKFKVIKCDIDLVETFPEETMGYHGIVTILFTLNRI